MIIFKFFALFLEAWREMRPVRCEGCRNWFPAVCTNLDEATGLLICFRCQFIQHEGEKEGYGREP